jgi:diguanylate cyclase (GGDEF)-like protein
VIRDRSVWDSGPEQGRLQGFARSIAEVEWLLLILVILYLYVTRPDLARDFRVIGALIGFTGFVLVFRYAPGFTRTRLKIVLETLAMVIFLTLVLALVGLEASPLVNLYLLPIITASLALGKRSTVLLLALVSACYVGIAALANEAEPSAAAIATQAIGMLAPFVLVAFLTTLLVENIRSASEQISVLAVHDEVTRALNMDAFARFLAREHESASRAGKLYTLLMLDVSHLKLLNEAHGRDAGNLALRLVADAVTRVIRHSDVIARYGGDEFIVFLRDTDRALGEEVAQRIRNVVFATTLELDAKIVRLKVHVGVVTYPEDGPSIRALMAGADRAMVQDKSLRAPASTLLLQ